MQTFAHILFPQWKQKQGYSTFYLQCLERICWQILMTYDATFWKLLGSSAIIHSEVTTTCIARSIAIHNLRFCFFIFNKTWCFKIRHLKNRLVSFNPLPLMNNLILSVLSITLSFLLNLLFINYICDIFVSFPCSLPTLVAPLAHKPCMPHYRFGLSTLVASVWVLSSL